MKYLPQKFKDFIGNEKRINHLKTLVRAYNKTGGRFPHLGFYGFAGTGKTTLARVLANEYGAEFYYYNGAAIKSFCAFCLDLLEKCKTHCGIMRTDDKDSVIDKSKNSKFIVLIDEAHGIPNKMQIEFLSFLSENKITINIGKTVRVGEVPFLITVVMATTHSFKLCEAIQRRLEPIELSPYTEGELHDICKNFINGSGFSSSDGILLRIARRSVSAGRCIGICERCIDYAVANGKNNINGEIVDSVFDNMGIGDSGFTENEKRLLVAIYNSNGKASIEVLSALSQFPKQKIQEEIEPAMIRKGLIRIGSGGRELTNDGLLAIGIRSNNQDGYIW